jgi:protein transport protein SEC24
VPVVTDTVVARCFRCKTYINPFVQFTAGALQWKCNMCGMDNDVPQAFDWDIVSGQQVDRYSRPELNYGCVDFVAPAEYTIRPPQPPVYVFVIDTSFQSIQTGMVSVVADAIKESLDKIPNEDGRTKIAFISADSAVGFYKLTCEEPEILVVGDLQDMYLPRSSSELIVNLVECRSAVEDLLNKMKNMYQNTHSPSNCLGSALQAARKLLVSFL